MKKKSLILVLAILTFALILSIPNMVKAAEYLTYSDTAQGVEWEYVLENNSVTNLRCKTAGKTGTITIPSTIDGKTVVSLAGDKYFLNSSNGAFKGFAGITSVTIPNSITKIGASAFSNCTGLTSIKIPDSVTEIGTYAFSNCTGLKTITIPNSVTTIATDAFSGCSGLKEVTFSTGLTNIGNYAFKDCTGLKSITIPNSVTIIGEYAFSGCSGLTSVTLSNNLSKLSEGIFKNCSGLTSIKLPNNITTISGGYYWNGAFSECTGLSKLLIPDTVASIGENAFYNCKKLTIFGNDGQVSKTYAEENKIKFDYIKNWDNPGAGTDITKPTVKSIEVSNTSVLGYYDSVSKMYKIPTGFEIAIFANFSENIKGKAPTLTIKFGEGSNIDLTEGTVNGSKITYIYKIKSTDKGVISAVDFKGGSITDTAGNTATLSHPEIKLQYGGIVYANGTATNVSNGNGSSSGTGTSTGTGTSNGTKPSTSTGTSSSSGSSSKPSTSTTKKDPTTASGKMPQTGISYTVIISCVAVIGAGAFVFSKYRNLRDI